MSKCLLHIMLALQATFSSVSWAEEATLPAVGIGADQVITVLAGLAFVLALVFGCGWLVTRLGGMQSARSGAIKVVSVQPVGSRERLALVEVGGQQLLLGVTAQQVSLLHTFDEPVVEAIDSKSNSQFAQKLQQMLSRS
jgi:flagellar protein FliO/FliZ